MRKVITQGARLFSVNGKSHLNEEVHQLTNEEKVHQLINEEVCQSINGKGV